MSSHPRSQPRNTPTISEGAIGTLQRPWCTVRRPKQPEAVFALARQNYKVYANIGDTLKCTRRFVAVIDTEAGSRFILLDQLPVAARARIKRAEDHVEVRNASGNSLPIVGTIDPTAQVRSGSELVKFYVAETLAKSVILGCVVLRQTCRGHQTPAACRRDGRRVDRPHHSEPLG